MSGDNRGQAEQSESTGSASSSEQLARLSIGDSTTGHGDAVRPAQIPTIPPPPAVQEANVGHQAIGDSLLSPILGKFRKSQENELEEMWRENKHPTKEQMERIAKMIGSEYEDIKDWVVKRRERAKEDD